MVKNVGTIDRVLRILIGLALVGWGLYAKNWIGVIGIIPILTGIVSFCPLYKLFGLSTCPLKKPNQS